MSLRACRDVRADLSAYLDGDLDAGLTGETRAHLESCAACRSELDLLYLTVGALRRLPDLPPPAAILAGVRARLQPEPWYRRLLDGGLRPFDFPLRAAATLLVVLGISLFVARYPNMPKTVSQDFSPQSPVLPSRQPQAEPAPGVRPAPAGRVAGADRQAAPQPTAPTRRDLRAKGALDPSALPQRASPGVEAASPKSSAVAGAGARDLNRAAPAPLSAPAAALKDALREESSLEKRLPAAPRRTVMDKPEQEIERTLGAESSPASQPAGEKIESRAAVERKADSGSGLGYARFAGGKEKETAPTVIGVFCLLRPDGDTVNDLELLLRREGAVDILVSALDPPALRKAFARHRGRLGSQQEPSQGWSMTARVQAPALARLIEALAERTRLSILEQPPAPAAPGSPAELLDLRVTVLP